MKTRQSSRPLIGWGASNQIQVAISSMKAPGSRRKAMPVFCASVLLLVGYVQAAHFCALPATASQHGIGCVDLGSTRVPCLLCISLHAPSRAALLVSVSPASDSSAAMIVFQPVFRSGVQGFALHVRPPPAA
jgi:hypothetical protein